MSHSLPANFRLDNFNSAFLAHHTAMLHSLIATAETLVVLDRPEYLCTEQTVSFRLECPVIYSLRFFNFSPGPRDYILRRSQRNLDGTKSYRVLRLLEKTIDIFHWIKLPLFLRFSVKESVYTFSINSTSIARPCNSLTSTLKDSGRPGSRVCSPFTIASYILVLPATSSDLTVRNSCSAWAAP